MTEVKLNALWELMQEVHCDLTERYQRVAKFENYLEQIKQMNPEPESPENYGCDPAYTVPTIQLTVGGKQFSIRRTVLMTEQATDSMLFALGYGWFDKWGEQDTNIDQSSDYFTIILDWLRLHHDHKVVDSETEWLVDRCDRNSSSVTCLKVEAQYYGLDQLVELCQSALARLARPLVPVLLSTGRGNWYTFERTEITQPYGIQQQATHLKHVPSTLSIIPGFYFSIEFEYYQSSHFVLVLYSDDDTRLGDWVCKTASCTHDVHRVVLSFDWSQWNSVESRYDYQISTSLNGQPWVPSKPITKINECRFIAPYVGTYTTSSRVAITGASIV